MNSAVNAREANPPTESPTPTKISWPDMVIVWMFFLCFAAIGLFLIGDLIAGFIGR